MRKVSFLRYGCLVTASIALVLSGCSKVETNDLAPQAGSNQLKATLDYTIWALQQPDGSQLNTIDSQTKTSYFYYSSDHARVFYAPRTGVTTPNSNNTRTELRQKASWYPNDGTHALYGTLRVVTALGSVCVGQIHLDQGSPASTKPLCELYCYPDGSLHFQVEAAPSGGSNTYSVGSVPIGTTWDYEIKLQGTTLSLSVNGTWHTYTVNSSFLNYSQYFKAGCYNQSSGSGADEVDFYTITVKSW